MTDLWDSDPGKGGAGFAAEGAEIQEGGQPCGLTEPQRARRRPPIEFLNFPLSAVLSTVTSAKVEALAKVDVFLLGSSGDCSL